MVGEAGLDPNYFHHTLTYYEAQDYITGYNRRHRHVYEAARMIHGVVGGLFAKNYQLPEFPWDKENRQKPHEYTEDEIEDLRREAKEWEQMMNAKG